MDGNRVLEFEYPNANTSYKVRKSNWSFNVSLIEGDMNSDEYIDILDVISIVNFILSGDSPHPLHLYKADMNKTGVVDVTDIITILDLILSG